MWIHKNELIYPLAKLKPDPTAAKLLTRLLEFEYGSAMCYLCQRHAMPYREGKQTLLEIGAEELGHFELLATMIRRLTRNLSAEDLIRAGMADHYLDHTLGVACACQTMFLSKGDPITDLHECLAKEQAARTTLDNLLRLMKDEDVIAPLRFLRERELTHYERFNELLASVQQCIGNGCCYDYNPAFDLCQLNPSDDD